jgi:hypothetical protein
MNRIGKDSDNPAPVPTGLMVQRAGGAMPPGQAQSLYGYLCILEFSDGTKRQRIIQHPAEPSFELLKYDYGRFPENWDLLPGG